MTDMNNQEDLAAVEAQAMETMKKYAEENGIDVVENGDKTTFSFNQEKDKVSDEELKAIFAKISEEDVMNYKAQLQAYYTNTLVPSANRLISALITGEVGDPKGTDEEIKSSAELSPVIELVQFINRYGQQVDLNNHPTVLGFKEWLDEYMPTHFGRSGMEISILESIIQEEKYQEQVGAEAYLAQEREYNQKLDEQLIGCIGQIFISQLKNSVKICMEYAKRGTLKAESIVEFRERIQEIYEEHHAYLRKLVDYSFLTGGDEGYIRQLADLLNLFNRVMDKFEDSLSETAGK